MEFSKFQKQPWYEKSNKTPPPLPYPLENAFHNVYTSIMQPKNWYQYNSNLNPDQKKAVSLSRCLPSQGVGIYCQDKSSRICFASLANTNQKVENLLSDGSKYKKLDSDHSSIYQPKIADWYRKYKPALKSIQEDIGKFLVPENVSKF